MNMRCMKIPPVTYAVCISKAQRLQRVWVVALPLEVFKLLNLLRARCRTKLTWCMLERSNAQLRRTTFVDS